MMSTENDGNASFSNNNTVISEEIIKEAECALVGFLPFTANGAELEYFGLQQPQQRQSNRNNNNITEGERQRQQQPPNSWQFTHMAAALMAVDHFNERNSIIVPRLTEMIENNCPNFKMAKTIAFSNTDFRVATVSQFLIQQATQEDITYCGIVGPYIDEAALEASSLASGFDIPLVTHGAQDNRLSSNFLHPHAARTTANLHAVGEAMVNWFQSRGRTDFLATITITAPLGEQIRQAVDGAAKEAGFNNLRHYTIAPPWTGFEPNRGIGAAVRNVARDGFRNIVVALNNLGSQLQLLVDYCQEYGLNEPGKYVWMISGNVDYAQLARRAFTNANVSQWLQGAASVRVLDGFSYNPAIGKPDAFLEAWKRQNATFVQRVNDLHPIRAGRPGAFVAPPSYFLTRLPQQGAAFMYDAVMSQAIGKCRALAQQEANQQSGNERNNNNNVNAGRNLASQINKGDRSPKSIKGSRNDKKHSSSTGKQQNTSSRRRALKAKKMLRLNPHLKSIVEAEFEGATGKVAFGDEQAFQFVGNRKRDTISYGVYNFRAAGPAEKRLDPSITTWYYLTSVLQGHPARATWTPTFFSPFIFSGGSADPPLLLRNLGEQNYLSLNVQITGWAFCILALCSTLASAAFFFTFREHPPIRQSQPAFLYILMAGCFVMAIPMLTLSFDEGNGWTNDQLDSACLATPWLLSLGFIAIYSALFSKLWRINKVMQSTRQKVEIRHVLVPFAILCALAITVLIVWTITDPFIWARQIIVEETFETYGRCTSRHAAIYIAVLASLMALSTGACAYMAWMTRRVDERFSEANWIFYTIFVQIQVLVMGIPVLVILGDSSAEATYLGRALLIFVIVFSTLLMMVGPKVFRVMGLLRQAHKDSLRTGSGSNTSNSGNNYTSGRQRQNGYGNRNKRAPHDINRGSSGRRMMISGLRQDSVSYFIKSDLETSERKVKVADNEPEAAAAVSSLSLTLTQPSGAFPPQPSETFANSHSNDSQDAKASSDNQTQ